MVLNAVPGFSNVSKCDNVSHEAPEVNEVTMLWFQRNGLEKNR
jgi:hypothetical protein